MSHTPYFFCRNRDLGTISVYVGYRDVRCLPPICIYMVSIHIVSANWHPPTQRGVIISQPKTSFLGVVFDVDHDFECLKYQKNFTLIPYRETYWTTWAQVPWCKSRHVHVVCWFLMLLVLGCPLCSAPGLHDLMHVSCTVFRTRHVRWSNEDMHKSRCGAGAGLQGQVGQEGKRHLLGHDEAQNSLHQRYK